uniref:Reverse transcriptase domain-containing protein n=1 Tax=Tanacetum cinerariifolium TaxID=118510 RepID=A0A6L2JCM5_TANCI|nr:reverse transcriptase domain-containing protein [Tanacetum cinerariifolium]
MRTRNSYFPNNSSVTIPRRRNKRHTSNVVEPELGTIVEVTLMADNRTMEELLQAPTEGYAEAIVIPEINADHFKIKTNLLQLVQANPYHGFERENPHTHINNLKRITSTLKFKDVQNDVIKLMMFPYSLEGTARVWYDKETPNSILTWEDLVNKFVNSFFPPSKTTHLKNEISRFTQKFEETFGEAWKRFKEMLRARPHYGFTELAQIDTFYNGLNDNDQDSLNATAGGNLLSKTTREALQIIENKSKVRYSRNNLNVSRMNTTSRENASKTDDRIDKLAHQISTLVDIFAKKVVTPALVKAVKESCVTCGGNHAYYNCHNTDSNQPSVCVATGTYNQVAPQNRASNYMAPPGFAPVQNNQNRFNQNQGQGNNFNRGNNFYGNQPFQVPNQGFQNQPFQVPNNPVQQGFSNEFSSYKIANDQMMRNMQNQINSLKGEFDNEIQNTMKTQQTVLMEQQNALQNNLQNMLSGFFQNQSSTSSTLPSNTIPNLKGEMKAITTRSGVAYEGPSIPTNPSPKKVVERETEETTDKEQTNFQGSTAHIQPPVTPIPKTDVPKILPKPNIPYPSRLNDQKLRKKATNQMEKLFQIFQDLHFDISFADALLLMPKFSSTIKSLLTNKDKSFELAKILLNENCSAMLLKKLPEKLGDPGKFLIPCDILRMDLSLPKLTPTRMTLELADQSINRPKGVAEYIFVNVGKFHFLINFIVVDFKVDPRVPLILGRSFLRTGRALIDVYREGITLRVNDEAVTFNLNQTTRYSSTYDDLSVNRIDIIDVAREEYAQEILGFSNNSSGGNPTSTSEPILSDSSPSITPFEGSNFISEEIEAYLKDKSISPEIDHADFKAKSSIEEPPELELKDLPSHLEYAYLKGVDKLPVIIAKDLKVNEKETLLKVLKSHKRAIAWKITNIKGIDPRFCIHKILMEDDYKPAVQSQRWVNPKIHEVIKKEVIKLLDAEMIYPISDSPWDCIDAFDTLKKKLTEASILVIPDWNLPFELMCDASDFAIGAKGMENLATDHLSRLENPHKDVFENKDINENFLLETLGKISSGSTPWFADFANFHAGRILSLKECRPNKRRNSLRTLNITSGTIPTIFGYVRIKSFDGVCMVKKLMISSKLVMKDPPGPSWCQFHRQEKAKALLTNDDRVVVKFLKYLFARFGTLRAIISDRGTYFCNDKFAKVMSKYGVTHRLSTAYHPQTSGTAYKTPIGCTPYKLVYETSCHLPIELEHKAYWALKHVNFDLKTAGDHRNLQLNELNELRDQAYENSLIYKEKTKKLHDSKIKTAFSMLLIEFYSSILV